jgi:DNA-binding protein HU-beta
MTKAELVSRVAQAAGITKAKAEKAVNEMRGAIIAALSTEGKFFLSEFGTFAITRRQARMMNSFGKGTMAVQAHNTVKFKPSPFLKEMVNR